MRWTDQPAVHFTPRLGRSRRRPRDGIDRRLRPEPRAGHSADRSRSRHYPAPISQRHDVPAESWTRRFEWPTIATGPLDVQGSVSGPLRRPLIAAAVDGGPMTLAAIDQRVDRVTGQVQFQDGLLRVDRSSSRRRGGARHRLGQLFDADGGAGRFGRPSRLRVCGTSPRDHDTRRHTRRRSSRRRNGYGQGHGHLRQSGHRSDFLLAAAGVRWSILRSCRGKSLTTANDVAQVDVTASELGTHVTGTVGLRGERPFDLSGIVNTADSALAAHLGALDVEVGAMELAGARDRPPQRAVAVVARRHGHSPRRAARPAFRR